MAIVDIGVGLVANDGTGDSIRDAFIKSNANFRFLESSVNDLITGNLIATGNVSLRASVPSYWTGTYYLNGAEIATVTNLFGGGTVANPTYFTSAVDSTSNVTGAVTVTGGLGVGGTTYLTDLRARSINTELGIGAVSISATTGTFGGEVTTGAMSTTGTYSATGNISGLNLKATNQLNSNTAVIKDEVTVGDQAIKAWGANGGATFSGNVVTGNVAGTTGAFTNVTGTVQTAAQPNITSVGTLTTLAIAGNVTSGNLTSGIGTFSNLTVQTVPTVKSATNKEYVLATVVGFAIGLGS